MSALDPVFVAVLVGGYTLLFLPAAVHKWRDLAVFEAVLAAYRLLPRGALPVAARAVPLLEAAAALGLWGAATRPLAVGTVEVLLLAYALAIGVNLARGRTDLDCGCTGPLERRPVAAWMVWRNGGLALAALPLLWPSAARPLVALDVFSVAAALLTVALLWLASDRLWGQVAPRGAALKASR